MSEQPYGPRFRVIDILNRVSMEIGPENLPNTVRMLPSPLHGFQNNRSPVQAFFAPTTLAHATYSEVIASHPQSPHTVWPRTPLKFLGKAKGFYRKASSARRSAMVDHGGYRKSHHPGPQPPVGACYRSRYRCLTGVFLRYCICVNHFLEPKEFWSNSLRLPYRRRKRRRGHSTSLALYT
jgi:hypothetical protein